MGKTYSTDYYEKPGITFPVNIKDPKERVEAYLEAYGPGTEESEVRIGLMIFLRGYVQDEAYYL